MQQTKAEKKIMINLLKANPKVNKRKIDDVKTLSV